MDSFELFIKSDIQRKALVGAMLSRIDTIVILIGMDGNIKFANDALKRIIGIDIENKDYKYIADMLKESDLEPIIKAFEYVAELKKPCVIEKQTIYRKDNYELNLKISMDYIDLGDDGYIILSANDYTREVQLSKVKDTVIRLNNMLSHYHSLDDYFDDILKSLVEIMPYVKLGSVLIADENECMTMKANVGYNKQKAEKFRLTFKESFFYRKCGQNYKYPVIINDLNDYSMEGVTDILDNINGISVASSLSSPIIIDGKLKGLLNLDSAQNNVFGHEDLEIMQFLTEQISLVLTSHQLLNRTIYLSKYDQLTGLYSRRYLDEFENVIIPHSIRYKQSFYFVMMDINNLKQVNDSYGHLLGDTYLVEFTKLLKANSRETDILIRIGGDEFAGVYFDIDSALLNKKLESVNYKLKAQMQELGVDCNCSFAFGMSSFPDESQRVDELMKIADQRMYSKKLQMKKSY